MAKFFIVLYSFSLSAPFIFSFLFSLTLRFLLFSLKPQSSPLNLSLSLCLPLPVSLGAVALLDLGASVLTKTLTFAAVGDSIPWLIALTFFFARGSSHAFFFALAFNTIGWTDWAKAAIVPGLVSLIVGVICNGVRRGAVVVWGDFVMGWCR